MKTSCDFNILRVIDIFDNKTESLIKEIVLSEKDFPLYKLKQIIGKNRVPDDDYLYLVYDIKPNMKKYFEDKLNIKFDFKKNTYELTCYQTNDKINKEKGIRKCTK